MSSVIRKLESWVHILLRECLCALMSVCDIPGPGSYKRSLKKKIWTKVSPGLYSAVKIWASKTVKITGALRV